MLQAFSSHVILHETFSMSDFFMIVFFLTAMDNRRWMTARYLTHN